MVGACVLMLALMGVVCQVEPEPPAVQHAREVQRMREQIDRARAAEQRRLQREVDRVKLMIEAGAFD